MTERPNGPGDGRGGKTCAVGEPLADPEELLDRRMVAEEPPSIGGARNPT
jgi:hypothetical protein